MECYVRKFWQTNWFEIQFNSFETLNPNKLASEEFYDKFYKVFFKKFNSYEDLSKDWQKDKRILAEFILEQIKDKNKILSIGCGSGFVENELSSKWDGELIAIEPSKNASKWVQENKNIKLINGYFPDCLDQKEKFDFAYMSYIEYVFNDSMYVDFLKKVKEYPIDDFLLIGASVYAPNFKESVKYSIKNLLSSIGFYNQQLWGYQRTIEEHLAMFKQAGYKNIKYGQLENSVYWIRAKNE